MYLNSLKRTRNPHSDKNFFIPKGDTFIPLKGKKNRVLSNGIKKPTPSPPEVMASKTPCDTVDKKITRNQINLFVLPMVLINNTAQSNAKRIECENPRALTDANKESQI
jgi:hypothetical protein